MMITGGRSEDDVTLSPALERDHRVGPWSTPSVEEFCHQALIYEDDHELLGVVEQFVREGLDMGERSLVMLSGSKIDLLRDSMGDDATHIDFADMDQVGANPARILPTWRSFLESVGSDKRARGVGEPVSAERSPAALAECQIHETLLNIAFGDSPGFWLLCPYCSTSLEGEVLEEAGRSHPFVTTGGSTGSSDLFSSSTERAAPWPGALASPPSEALRITVDVGSVMWARHVIGYCASALGMSHEEAGDLQLAIHEVIANSLRHGGGVAEVCVWAEGDLVLCDVADHGVFDKPLAGRIRPGNTGMHGRGLWTANHLCDLVQIRSVTGGTIVRLHMRRSPPFS